MLNHDLERIGLGPKEVQVYLALLDMGEANIQQIVEKSGVKRTTVYDVLEDLKDRHLIHETRLKKRTYYVAEDPRKLEENLTERRDLARKIMPNLMAMSRHLHRKPRMRYYEDADGIKEVYKDTLKYPDQEILAWIPEESVTKFDRSFHEDFYVPERVKKNISMRAIAPDHPVIREFQAKDKESMRRIQFVNGKEYPFDVEISLYGKNLVAIMSFEEEMAMIVESPKIYATLKSIFEMQWLPDED